MKRISSIAFIVAISGCAAQGPKPVTLQDGTQGFLATCGGTARSWADCYESASKACPNGFNISEKEHYEHEGYIKRKLFYKCK